MDKKIQITEFTPLQRNTMRGFATVFLPDWGIEIPGFMVHKQNKKEWVELPAHKSDSSSGKWVKNMSFDSRTQEKEFKNMFMKELKDFLIKNGRIHELNDEGPLPVNDNPGGKNDDEVPF